MTSACDTSDDHFRLVVNDSESSRCWILPRIATRSDPRDRTSPDPHLVLVGWNSEPDSYGPLGPGNRLGLRQLFDTVLPQHPGLHLLRDRRGADRQLPHLLWQQAPWLALGEAGTFGHASEYRTGVLVSRVGLDDGLAT